MASAPDDLAVRSTLGSYRLLAEVGRDPLGVLYLACPAGARSFPKWAIVRRMHGGLARDPVMVHAFLAATQASVRMVHRNIATSFDFGGKMALPWVARPHLFGATMLELLAYLAAEGLTVPWPLAVHLVIEAAEGVAAVRARLPNHGPPMGFLTGAVTPSVFVTEAGEVKIVDGCLALIEGLPLIDSRSLPYRPRGPAPVGANAGRADAFGLGVILWELIAGRRLFAGQNDEETSRLVEARVVPSLRTTARMPPFLDDVVARAIGPSEGRANVPGDAAYAGAADLGTDLRNGLAALGLSIGAGDVARLIADAFPQQLAEQRAALDAAWREERALQERGDAPSDVTSEADVTRPLNETTRDTTTETAIARRPGSVGDGFDEVPTLARSRNPAPSSWRPEAPSSPRLLSVPRIDYLPDTGTPPPPSSSSPFPLVGPPAPPPPPPAPPPPPPRSSWTPAVIVAPPSVRPPLASRAAETQVSEALRNVRQVDVGAGYAPPPSPLLVGGIGLGLGLVVVLAIALYRESSTDAGPVARLSPSASAASPRPVSAPTARRPSEAWTTSPAPTVPIPVTSPDDLPRAPDDSPGVLSHRPPPAVRGAGGGSGRVGLLTVFCTPACDEVTDGLRALGPSPVFKVPAYVGLHRLRLRVDALGVEKTVSVTVHEGDTAVVRETLGE